MRAEIRGTLGGNEREPQIIEVEGGTAPTAAGAARESVLLLAVYKDPFGDARLDGDFNQLVHQFDELLAKIVAVVQAGKLEGFERNSGAGGEVLEHRYGGFHAKASGNQRRIVERGGWEEKDTPDFRNVNYKVTVLIGI